MVAADPRGNLPRSTVGSRRLTRNDVNIIAQKWGAAINALDITEALIATARWPIAELDNARLYGALDATGSISTSWTGFAAAKFAQAVMHGRRPIDVSGLSAARYPTPAAWPANSQLQVGEPRRVYGLHVRKLRSSTQDSVKRVILSPETERRS